APLCSHPAPLLRRGCGTILSARTGLPRQPAALINPRGAVPTKDVFARLAAPRIVRLPPDEPHHCPPVDCAALISYLRDRTNDLEPPAIALTPVIAAVLNALQRLADVRLPPMSASRATPF